MAARPRTLPAAIAPVLVGTAAAVERGRRAAAGRRRSSPRWSARSSSRSAPTSPTTTPTRKRGADTADRLGPGAGHLGRARRPAPGARRDLGRLRGRRRLRRSTSTVARRAGDPADRRPLDRRRRPLHRRAAALRLRRPRRGLRLPLLRPRRRQRLLLRAARGARRAAARPLGRGRPALDRDPRRQQRPRHRDRPAGRQAHARRADRPRADAAALRGARRRRLPRPAGRRCCVEGGPWWALLGLVSAAAAVAPDAGGAAPAPTARR